MEKSIIMPKLSGSMEKGILAAWEKEPGAPVKKGDVLFEVETDKVVSEIESQDDGFLEKTFFEEGDEVPVGGVVAVIRTE